LKSLPPGQKEAYASRFDYLASKLRVKQDEITSSRKALPAELPDALPQPNVLYKKNRRRGYTGREAAEYEESMKRLQAERAIREAESKRVEEHAWNKELKEELLARHQEARAIRTTRVECEATSIIASGSVSAPAPTRAPPWDVIKISSDDLDETKSLVEEEIAAHIKPEKADGAFDMAAFIDTGSPLIPNQASRPQHPSSCDPINSPNYIIFY
jgi:hypothetical protein